MRRQDFMRLLNYDPDTGAFTWLVDPNTKGGPVHAGAIAGTVTSTGHVKIGVQEIHYLAHRLAWFFMTGRWPKHEVDHRNGQRADNRWVNLRAATVKQQRENATPQKRSASGIRGVYWYRRLSRWQSVINHNKKNYSLGYHDTLLDAAAARKSAELRFFTQHRQGV